jgi:hypothetical protein
VSCIFFAIILPFSGMREHHPHNSFQYPGTELVLAAMGRMRLDSADSQNLGAPNF